ncbi:MAG: radical SAM family heme chaperone HemW [Bacteroidia bacterium]
MAGIYIHIPFCKQACFYCNFHFSTSLQYTNEFVDSLLKEIDLKSPELNKESFKTLYFGGGTPSILNSHQFEKIVLQLSNHIDLKNIEEFTIEVNPDDMNEDKLKFWKEIGVNRLSIGTQSFRDEDLQLMNRAHSAQEAYQSIQLAQSIGFHNISIDLIYGIPGLSKESWLDNLNKAIKLQIPHISSYCLTVEEKTALAHLIKESKLNEPDEELASEQFIMMIEHLQNHQIEQYEISNFAKAGYESKHNSSYWSGEKYIGLGPGAHSFDGNNRTWNISNNQAYFKALKQGELPQETELLSLENRYNEFIMTSLRTREGIEKEKMRTLFNNQFLHQFHQGIEKWLSMGKLIETETHYLLSKEARFFADGIASDLFVS